jgi:hypothetical protein
MSFLVEVRHWMLKRAIALEITEELVLRNDGLVAALGDDGKIVQILQELFVFADGKHDGGSLTVLISQVLQDLAHSGKLRSPPRKSRARRELILPVFANAASAVFVGREHSHYLLPDSIALLTDLRIFRDFAGPMR